MLLYLPRFSCGSSTYTQSFTRHLTYLTPKTLTKHLLIFYKFDGVAKVRTSLWFWIFLQGNTNLASDI